MPTVAESGYPAFEAVVWMAVMVPAGTPPRVVGRLHAELAKIIRSAAMKSALWDRQWIDPVGSSPSELAAVLAHERRMWSEAFASSPLPE